MKPYSTDLRKRVLAAIDDVMPIEEAVVVFEVSKATIHRWQVLQKATGNVEPKTGYQNGHSHKVKDWDSFIEFVEKNKHLIVREMIIEWEKLNGESISKTTMKTALAKINYTSKKNFNYAEASDEKRKKFLELIRDIKEEDIVYSDETGIDDNEVPLIGWAPKGERCHDKKRGYRKKRYNIIASLNCNQLFAPFIFEGHTTARLYEAYIEQVLAPSLRAGMTLVIDNARFHKSKRVIELIEAVGCYVIFLPPYSPDLNPIEHFWAVVKKAIRSVAEMTSNFFHAIYSTLASMSQS